MTRPVGSRPIAMVTCLLGMGHLTWSPFGFGQQSDSTASTRDRILFVSEWQGREEIYTMEPDGSCVERLTTTGQGDGSWSPAWSPNGARIVFAADSASEGHVRGIYIIRVDGSGTEQLVRFERVYVVRPEWSPDGQRIVFSSGIQFPDGEWEWDLFVVTSDGRHVERLTQHAGVNYQARWSPDGSQLVFDSSRDGDWEIYVTDANGSNVHRLTRRAGVDARPDWSPDGKRIAFHSRSGDERSQIYVMDADGAQVQWVTNAGSFAVHPDWGRSSASCKASAS